MVTNIEVRDELVKCYTEAHKEFMKRGAELTGQDTSDEKIKEKVITMLHLAFKEANADFENPSKEDFANVMTVLQKQAKAAGRDEEIIQKHTKQMLDMLGQLVS